MSRPNRLNNTNARGSNARGDYNLSISPLWYNQRGNLRGLVVDKEVYDAIQKVEIGGKLLIKFLDGKKGEKTPDAYLEYLTPAKLAALRTEFNAAEGKTTEEGI